MAQTPLSAGSSYCSIDAFLKRNDARRVGELLEDIGERSEAEAIRSGVGLPANSVTQEVLDSASGQLESACLVGQRYQPADLQALTGVSARYRDTIIAALAMWELLCRRKAETPPTDRAKDALAQLERLRDGTAIFGLLESAQAGIPDDTYLTEDDLETMDLATRQAGRYFGTRGNELRAGR